MPRILGPIPCMALAFALVGVATLACSQKPGATFRSSPKKFSVIVPRFPLATRVESQHDTATGFVQFMGDAGHLKVLLAVVMFPQGSILADGKTGTHPDSYRGLLCFVHAGFACGLHVELALPGLDPVTSSPPTPGEFQKRAEEMLPGTHRTITLS